MNVNNINNEKGDGRVLRGGSWYINPSYLRVAYRSSTTPDLSGIDVGFRIMRSLDNCEVDKVNEEGDSRVLSGGSWRSSLAYLCVAYRLYGTPADNSSYIGFRLVCSIV